MSRRNLENLRVIGLDKVLAKIAKKHRVDPKHIISETQMRGSTSISLARGELWTVLVEAGLAYAEIGRLLNRHHTSILHGVRRYRDTMEQEQNKRVVREVSFSSEEDENLRALARLRGMTVADCLRAFARTCQPGGSGWVHPAETKNKSVPPAPKKPSVPPKKV